MDDDRVIKKIKDYLVKHDELFIFSFAFVTEIIFGLILIDKYGSTIFNLDSASYLYNARNTVDNGVYSGLATLVGTWPPIFGLMQLPFVGIDKLYTTGFSGTIVNAVMTGGTAVFLYRLLGGKNNRFAILAPIIFLSNIYTLIFGAIPLTEQVAIFFLTAASYFFKNYWDTGEVKEFIKCSVILIFGTLTKYEIWLVAIFIVIIFLIKETIIHNNRYKIGYAHIPLWGMVAWLFANYMIHRDIFWFNNNPLSNRIQTTIFPQYFKGSINLTLNHAFLQMDMTFGILLYLAIISIIFIIFLRKANWLVPLAIFFIPSIINIILMFQGYSAGWQRYFYTQMPGIILLTVILLDNIYSLSNKKRSHISNTINCRIDHGYQYFIANRILILSIFIGMSILSISIMTMADQSNAYKKEEQDIIIDHRSNKPWIFQGLDVSNERIFYKIENQRKVFISDLNFEFLKAKDKSCTDIKELIGDDKILMPSFIVTDKDPGIRADIFSVVENVSPTQIIDGFDYLDYEKIMAEPWNNTKFVIIVPIDDGLSYINRLYNGNFYLYNYYHNETWRSMFLNHYDLIYEEKNGQNKLFELKMNEK